MMLGAIVGDIVGSSYEGGACKGHNVFDLSCGNRFTDDTVLTLAVAKWLIVDKNHSHEGLVGWLQILGNKYINCGFSATFYYWLLSDKMEPYESIGNGSAMRVSPIGLYASSLDEALDLAKISAEVTHNSVSGIKGAQAIASCVYLAKIGRPKDFIRGYISGKFGYDLDFTIKGITESYKHSWVCDGTVPQAINAYLDGKDFKDVLSLAISLGGDTDTLAAMACSIAACTYDIPEELVDKSRCILPDDLLDICDEFEKLLENKKGSINNEPSNFDILNYYSVEDAVIAGEYPFAVNHEVGLKKLDVLRSLGVSVIVDLTEENELMPYYDFDALKNDEDRRKCPMKPMDVFETKRSICQGITNLSIEMLRSVGVHSLGVVCFALGIDTQGGWENKSNINAESNHIFTAALCNNRWILLDATWDCENEYREGKFIKSNDPTSHKYFDMTLEFLSNTHRLDVVDE